MKKIKYSKYAPLLQKHYGLVMYKFRNKLACLSKPVTIEKTLAYYENVLFQKITNP